MRITQAMNRSIVGYHRDGNNDWVAELDCHHNQHVRHNPPFANRPWVETPEGRQSRLGLELDCVLCDQLEIPEKLVLHKKTPQFTQSTIPRGLLAQHATKKGVWGRLSVEKGKLQYTVEQPEKKVFEIQEGQHANIAPEVLHSVKPIGEVQFSVAFFQPESDKSSVS